MASLKSVVTGNMNIAENTASSLHQISIPHLQDQIKQEQTFDETSNSQINLPAFKIAAAQYTDTDTLAPSTAKASVEVDVNTLEASKKSD